MTTREQINQAADKYTDNADTFIEYSDDGGWSDKNDIEYVEKAFNKGAEYGYNLALEKVCEYIKENINLYAYKLEKSDFPYGYPLTERIVLTDNFGEDVKQAMKL